MPLPPRLPRRGIGPSPTRAAPSPPATKAGTPRGFRESGFAVFPAPRFPFCLRALWAALLATTLLLRAADGDLRFSASLEAADRSAAGLTKLTSDQVAVIDAFVRRDTALQASAKPTAAADADAASSATKTFSQRLTAGERATANLAALTPAELARLDALVDRFQNARLARTLLAPPSYARPSRIPVTEKKKEREIHGSFSLSYGWGSGGYSEKTGSMVLNFEDPDRGFAISVGYSESHLKGGPMIYRDPLATPLPPIDR